jgi:hypothetical protein
MDVDKLRGWESPRKSGNPTVSQCHSIGIYFLTLPDSKASYCV